MSSVHTSLDFEAELRQLRDRHQLGFHAGNPIHQIHGQRAFEPVHGLLDVGFGPDAVNECQVRAGFVNGFERSQRGEHVVASGETRANPGLLPT